jgi:beta-lactamase regulating signal transducer with metallopeptidase domain
MRWRYLEQCPHARIDEEEMETFLAILTILGIVLAVGLVLIIIVTMVIVVLNLKLFRSIQNDVERKKPRQ